MQEDDVGGCEVRTQGAVPARAIDQRVQQRTEFVAGFVRVLGAEVRVVDDLRQSAVVLLEPATVLAVDLLGTALGLEEFGRVIAPGGAGLVISSMAGHMFPPFAPEHEHALAHTPADDLLALPFLDAGGMGQAAYGYAKRGNSASRPTASSGAIAARVNAISPGIILTPLARDEMSGPAQRPTKR